MYYNTCSAVTYRYVVYSVCVVSADLGDDGDTGGKPKDKKKDREARINAEITKKFGKAALSIRVANFFAGDYN